MPRSGMLTPNSSAVASEMAKRNSFSDANTRCLWKNLFIEQRWTPIFRPQVSFDFCRSAVDKKEQTYESKTQTTQCGLQGQSGIRSPGGAQNGRAIGARVCGASGPSHAVAGDDSGSPARTVRSRATPD